MVTLKMFKRCFELVIKVCPESFHGVSRKFQGHFRTILQEVSRVFHGKFQEFFSGRDGDVWLFQDFKGISKKFKECIKEVLKVF